MRVPSFLPNEALNVHLAQPKKVGLARTRLHSGGLIMASLIQRNGTYYVTDRLSGKIVRVSRVHHRTIYVAPTQHSAGACSGSNRPQPVAPGEGSCRLVARLEEFGD